MVLEKLNYQEALQYLYSLIPTGDWKFPGDIGLKRMALLLNEAGDPHKQYPVIHVAGTSGKGSTCAILASLLVEGGYKTGLHVSPHIVSLKERMQVNGELMSDDEFVALVEWAKPIVKRVSTMEYGSVSYFEAVLALTFEHFRREKADIAVVETGLGGTYDGTNVVDSLVSVITPIGFDHMHILGNALREIAGNKAGIIKKSNRIVVSARQREEAWEVIKAVAREKNVPLAREGVDFFVDKVHVDEHGTLFDFRYKDHEYKNLELKLLGQHQAHNAGLALTALFNLPSENFNFSEDSIRKGLKDAYIPGRLEVVQHDGRVFILDGAHNEDKMNALSQSLKVIWEGEKFECIYACKKDKDIKTILSILSPFCKRIIATEFVKISDTGKNLAMETEEIQKVFEEVGYKGEIVTADNPAEALSKVKSKVVLVTGSLFLVSEIRELLFSFSENNH